MAQPVVSQIRARIRVIGAIALHTVAHAVVAALVRIGRAVAVAVVAVIVPVVAPVTASSLPAGPAGGAPDRGTGWASGRQSEAHTAATVASKAPASLQAGFR